MDLILLLNDKKESLLVETINFQLMSLYIILLDSPHYARTFSLT